MEEVDHSDVLQPRDTVGLTLDLIAETSRPVASFKVDFRSRDSGSVDPRGLQVLLYQQSEFRSAWAHLEELRLELSLKPETLDWASNLVLNAPRLRKLALDLE